MEDKHIAQNQQQDNEARQTIENADFEIEEIDSLPLALRQYEGYFN